MKLAALAGFMFLVGVTISVVLVDVGMVLARAIEALP